MVFLPLCSVFGCCIRPALKSGSGLRSKRVPHSRTARGPISGLVGQCSFLLGDGVMNLAEQAKELCALVRGQVCRKAVFGLPVARQHLSQRNLALGRDEQAPAAPVTSGATAQQSAGFQPAGDLHANGAIAGESAAERGLVTSRAFAHKEQGGGVGRTQADARKLPVKAALRSAMRDVELIAQDFCQFHAWHPLLGDGAVCIQNAQS
jgi:hypothetical protein